MAGPSEDAEALMQFCEDRRLMPRDAIAAFGVALASLIIAAGEDEDEIITLIRQTITEMRKEFQ